MTGSRTSARTIASGSPVSSSSSRSASSAAWRRRVEHDSAADGRVRPQDDPVAARRNDGCAQPQLRVAAFAHEPGRHVARPEVSRHRGRDRLELLERDVEPPADRVVARLDQDIAALQARALDPGQVHRHALAGFGPLDLAIVHLDASRARAEARGLDPQLVARADGA